MLVSRTCNRAPRLAGPAAPTLPRASRSRCMRSVRARAVEPPAEQQASQQQQQQQPVAAPDQQQQQPRPAAPAADMVMAGPRGARKAGKQPRPQPAGMAAPAQQQQAPRAQRPIPIRGMVNKNQEPAPGEVRWDEGKLFPEGWEEMDGPTKVYQLYMGKRGALFWMSQLAWYGSITLGVSWALFRFVGPAVGLYSLKGDLLPSMM